MRTASIGVVSGLLSICYESPNLQLLQALVPAIIESVATAISANDEESARMSIEYVTEMVEIEFAFLRPNILTLIELILRVVKSENLDTVIRHLAAELFLTIVETKPGMIRKTRNCLQEMFSLLLNWGTHIQENSDWNLGEARDMEDADAALMEEALDRLSIALGGESICPILFSAAPACLRAEDWRFRHAALLAISVSAEGAKKYLSQRLQDVVNMVLPFFSDPHPRVRWAASHAIGQLCTDFQPDIQKHFHSQILTGIIKLFDGLCQPTGSGSCRIGNH